MAWGRLLLGFLALPLLAQPLAFRRYDNRDGMPGGQVLGLLEDRRGFLWVANNNALARLGPNGFQVFQETTLSSRGASVLLEDRQGSIWAVMPESKLLEIRGSRVVVHGPAQGLPPKEIFALAETTQGVLHVATEAGLLCRRQGRFEPVPLPPPWDRKPIFALAADDRGRLWMGGPKGALACWDGRTLTPLTPPPRLTEEWVGQLRHQPGRGLWVLSRTGMSFVGEDGVWREVPMPGLGPVLPRTFELTPQGELILSLGAQGVALRQPDGAIRLLSTQDGIPASGVACALRDRRGALWLGTNGDYLVSQTTPGLHALEIDLETHASLGLGAVTALLEEQAGTLLFGSTHGLFRWEANKGLTGRWTEKQGLPSREISGILRLPDGSIGISTARGLARLQGSRILPFAPALRQAQTYYLHLLAGRLWVATDEGAAELTLQGDLVKRHRLPRETGSEGLSSLASWEGKLLLGTRKGVWMLDPATGTFRSAYPEAPFANLSVYALRLTPEGRILVGTDTGLYVREPGASSWRHLRAGRELLDDGISWAEPLRDGTLAVGHARGVTLVRPDGSFHLTRHSGLISDETNQEASLVDRSGRLWFGMVGGLCSLDPEALPQHHPLPAPCIREALWGGQQALYPAHLDLPTSPDTLQLGFDTPYPACPVPPRYEVRMDGLKEGWMALPTGLQSQSFTGLRGGHYTFRLRASLDGQNWVEAPPLPIQIALAWHQYWTVRFLGFSALLGLLALLLRLRTRTLARSNALLEAKVAVRTEELALRSLSLERLHVQLKKNLESRIRLMNTVTHDLRSPLSTILISVDRLQEGASERVLKVLAQEALRLEAILATMLDKSRHEAFLENLSPRVCHPSEIVEGLSDTLTLRAETQGLRSELDLDRTAETVWILADIPSIQQVLFNLLENALKFTPAPGTVGLRTRVGADTFVFEVWDTGRGIASEHLMRIFAPFEQSESGDREGGWGLGLSICKELVEAHQGRIDVESRLGQGARFRVTLPLLNPEAPPAVH